MSKPKVGIATDDAHFTTERLTRYRAVDLSSEKGKTLLKNELKNSSDSSIGFRAVFVPFRC